MEVPQVWDISPTISALTPVWPGDISFKGIPTWKIENGCPVHVSCITMTTHLGAHTDAPSHYDPQGLSIDQVALEPYVGTCRVLHCIGTKSVQASDLINRLDGMPQRVLFRTYARAPQKRWDPDFAVITPGAIELLASRGVILVGTDSASLDPHDSKTLDAHHAVDASRMAVLEGVVLDDVPEGDYELIALPLKLAGMDASPVRAILRSLPTKDSE